MKKTTPVTNENAKLRAQAERWIKNTPPTSSEPTADTHKLLHELQVHQIELEMQCEELRQARSQCEAALLEYTELYDFAPVGYFTLDVNGTIQKVNLAGAALLGTAREKLFGKRLGLILEKKNRLTFTSFLAKVFVGFQSETLYLSLANAQGGLRLVHFEASSDASKETCRVIMTDISERQLYEDSLFQNNLELVSAKTSADKANRAKSEFLSGMSHELRTPLNAMLGFAQLLASADPPPTAPQQQPIEHIVQAGWHLLQLINEILDFSALESGVVSVAKESVLLSGLLAQCCAAVEPQAKQRRVSISITELDPLCRVQADVIRLRQVLISILANSVKSSQKNSTVFVSCNSQGPGVVRISVRDTGSGLAPDQLNQLFEPFIQLGLLGQESGSKGGAIVGLAVTKQLVTMMGGTISVQSAVGVGSEFWIDLLSTAKQAPE